MNTAVNLASYFLNGSKFQKTIKKRNIELFENFQNQKAACFSREIQGWGEGLKYNPIVFTITVNFDRRPKTMES